MAQPAMATVMIKEVPTTANQSGNPSWSNMLDELELVSACPQEFEELKNSSVELMILTAEWFPGKERLALGIGSCLKDPLVKGQES